MFPYTGDHRPLNSQFFEESQLLLRGPDAFNLVRDAMALEQRYQREEKLTPAPRGNAAQQGIGMTNRVEEPTAQGLLQAKRKLFENCRFVQSTQVPNVYLCPSIDKQ